MNWYAIYTRSKFEKKVYELLQEKCIEAYLPLYKKLRQWSDRKKWIEEPLISSYVFVRIAEKQHFQVLNTQGVVSFITFDGKAPAIPDAQIDTLKRILTTDAELEVSSEDFKPGDPIEIIAGSLCGMRGELVKHKGTNKVIINIESTGHSLLLTIPINYLQKVHFH